MSFIRNITGPLILFIISGHLFAQDSLNISSGDPEINRCRLTAGIVAGSVIYAGGSSVMYYWMYRKTDFMSFNFYNDSKSYLQADKFQHIFGTYVISYIGYNFLRSAGVSKEKAILFGGPLGFVLASPKEIVDGFAEGNGFSAGDFAANFAGSALFTGQQLLFGEQIIKNKFSFSRSSYARQANGYLGSNGWESLLRDYNGHTYWFSINANRFILKDKMPPWINIAAGYSPGGMFGAFENIESYNSVIIPETQRYRQYLLSLDVDWSRIKTRSAFINRICKMLVFIKLPFPALEYNSKGQFKGYWLYF